MKKLMKKLVAGIAAMTMVLAMGITAFAANQAGYPGTAEGDINIQGAIKDATYKAYKVFDVSYSGTNNEHVAYTIPENSKITSIDGFNTAFKTTTAGGKTYVSKAADTSQKDGLVSDATVINWLKNHQSEIAVGTPAEYTNTEGFANIVLKTGSKGYYFITSTAGDKSAVTIDTAHPSATVKSKIENKPTIPTDGKKINGASVNTMEVGGIANFTLQFTATSYNANSTTQELITSYTIRDTMDGFDITSDQLSKLAVKIGDTSIGARSETTNTTNDVYFETTLENSVLTVVIHNYDKGNFASPSDVVISYSATLTNKNLARKSTNKFTVDNVEGSSETHTYNYTVDVKKFAAGDTTETGLPGAKFMLVKKDDKGNITGYYNKGTDGVVTWKTAKNDGSEYATDSDGLLTEKFTGLKDGTYYLVETEAPKGYTLAEDTEVVLSPISKDAEATNLTKTFKVQDTAGSLLPSTGGIGTTIFYALGAALAIGAGVILVTRKRLSK